jgi:hypothetical protein
VENSFTDDKYSIFHNYQCLKAMSNEQLINLWGNAIDLSLCMLLASFWLLAWLAIQP